MATSGVLHLLVTIPSVCCMTPYQPYTCSLLLTTNPSKRHRKLCTCHPTQNCHGLPKRRKSCLQTHLHKIQPGDPTPALAIQKSYEVGGLLLPADAPHAAGHQNSYMQQRSCDVGCAHNTTLLTDSADGWCAALTHAGLLPTVLQPHLCLPSHLCLPRLAAQTLLQYLT